MHNVFGWFKRSPAPEIHLEAQAIGVGQDAGPHRLAARLVRLYNWLEANPDALPSKRQSMDASLKRHAHRLAGHGYAFPNTVEKATAILHEIQRGEK